MFLMKIMGVCLITILVLVTTVLAQDLTNERIRKISNRKQSIFLEKGIFHNGLIKRQSVLNTVRHSYSKERGFERVVFDFKTKKIPRIYGHISSKDKKLYLDLFDTEIAKNINSFGSSRYIKSIDFFPISKESLSIELNFKKNVSVDIFYLEKPGRFVVDIKS